jgi:hypothetical protein
VSASHHVTLNMANAAVIEAKWFLLRDIHIAAAVIAALVLGGAIFLFAGTRVAGLSIALVAAFRIFYIGCTLRISGTKRPVAGLAPQDPVLVKFPADEGYSKEMCYMAAVRVETPRGYCPVFPVHLDNVYMTTQDAVRSLEGVEVQGVFSHPLNNKHLFVNDRISSARRRGLLVRIFGWACVLCMSIFLATTG